MFTKIAIIDRCGLTPPILEKLRTLSEQPISIFDDFPETDAEIIKRIGDSDCILVSWHTQLTADFLRAAPALKFIAMCCSLYDAKAANVDIEAATKLGITVKGVRDYGDEGTVELIFAQLIYLLKGIGTLSWRAEPTELKNKSIGIIGLGTLGHMVAKTALHFGMHVFYFSRTRKPEAEEQNINYLSLHELLKTCDIVTTHVPKNTTLLTDQEFKLKKENSIFVNTSLGLTCDKYALITWLASDKSSFAIFDSDGAGSAKNELEKLANVIISHRSAGFSTESRERLSEKVLQNVRAYLSSK